MMHECSGYRVCRSERGFVALIFVLVMAAVMLTVGVALSLRSIENLQASSWYTGAAEARQLALTCVEEGLLRLRGSWASSSGALSLGSGSCTMDAALAGGTATVRALGVAGSAHRTITVTVNPTFAITGWEE